jgi:hypothetical protein
MAQRPGSVFLEALAAGAAAFHTHLLVLAEPGELWFAKIERDLIARGIFTPVRDLARKLMHYILAYNEDPKPIKWMYQDVSHRIKIDTNSSVTSH